MTPTPPPELGRYYTAMGANLLLNPTTPPPAATGMWMETAAGTTRVGNGIIRCGWKAMRPVTATPSSSANLVGGDGPVKEDGSYTYNFPGGSVIMNAGFSGPSYYAGANYGDSYCDGTMNEDADIITGEEGLLTNVTSVRASTGSTTSNSDFAPEWYAQLYGTLADEQEAGESLSYSSTVTDGPRAAVVNMVAQWGDKGIPPWKPSSAMWRKRRLRMWTFWCSRRPASPAMNIRTPAGRFL